MRARTELSCQHRKAKPISHSPVDRHSAALLHAHVDPTSTRRVVQESAGAANWFWQVANRVDLTFRAMFDDQVSRDPKDTFMRDRQPETVVRATSSH